MTPEPSIGDSATGSSLTHTKFWLFTHTHTIPAIARRCRDDSVPEWHRPPPPADACGLRLVRKINGCE